MSKMPEGFTPRNVSKKMIETESFGRRLAGVVSAEQIKAQVRDALATKGFAYGVFDSSKECTVLYIFRKETGFSSGNGKKQTILRFVASYTAAGCEDAAAAAKEYVYAELRQRMMLLSDGLIDWPGEEESLLVSSNGMTIFGCITGHDIKKISRRKLGKESFQRLAGSEQIRAQCMDALECKGVVYGLYNNAKECVSLYIFRKEPGTFKGHKCSKLVLVADHCAAGSEKERDLFVDVLEYELAELLSFTGTSVIDWYGKITTSDDIERAQIGLVQANFCTFLCLAIIWWFVFDSMFIGLLFAFAALCSMSGNVYHIAKDRKVSLEKPDNMGGMNNDLLTK